MDLTTVIDKIKISLSPQEYDFLYAQMRLAPEKVFQALTPVASNPEDAFINEVFVFFDGLIRDFGFDGVQENSLMFDVDEFDDFAKRLSKFPIADVAAMLIKMQDEEFHILGFLVAEQLALRSLKFLPVADAQKLQKNRKLKRHF